MMMTDIAGGQLRASMVTSHSRNETKFFTVSLLFTYSPCCVLIDSLICNLVVVDSVRPYCFQVATSGKLFTHVPLSPSGIIWYLSKGSDAIWLES